LERYSVLVLEKAKVLGSCRKGFLSSKLLGFVDETLVRGVQEERLRAPQADVICHVAGANAVALVVVCSLAKCCTGLSQYVCN
jgi:hypothetical protein